MCVIIFLLSRNRIFCRKICTRTKRNVYIHVRDFIETTPKTRRRIAKIEFIIFLFQNAVWQQNQRFARRRVPRSDLVATIVSVKEQNGNNKIWKLYYTLLLLRCDFFYFQAFERQRNIVYTERCFQRFTQRQLVVSIRVEKRKPNETVLFINNFFFFHFPFASSNEKAQSIPPRQIEYYWNVIRRTILLR